MSPLVSIIIPVYNGSNYVKEAIDSALAQTYKNIEIIVVNDGSNDDGATEKIALSFGDKIRYFYKANGGISSALNYGIEKMQGEYFSWLSHDDKYTETKIEKQIALLKETKKENTIFLCGSSFIDKNGTLLKRRTKKIKNGYYSNLEMFSQIFAGYSIGGCALLIPKIVFEKAGQFNLTIKYMQDMEMWYRALLKGFGFYCSDEIGVLSRVHGQQTTVTKKHWGIADAQTVGMFMVDNLTGLYSGKENLLKKYMFISFKRRNTVAAEKAYQILKERKEIGLFGKCKKIIIKAYGKVRPLIIKIYYKLFFRIKVKKEE